MRAERWRVGVLGLGWVARQVHLPYLVSSAEAEIVAAFDPDRACAQAVRELFGIPTLDSMEQLFETPSDVVFVCSPPATHGALARMALECGRHVVCEKPLAMTAEEAEAIAGLAWRRGLKLFCCLTNRYRPDVQRLAETTAAGAIGEPRYVRAEWLRSRGIPNTSGALDHGVLWDLGTHLVDLVLWVTGWGSPTHVCATSLTLAGDVRAERATWHAAASRPVSGPLPDDTSLLELQFGRGQAAHVEASWCAHVPQDRTELLVLGTTGALHLQTVFGWSPHRDEVAEPALAVSDPDRSRWHALLTTQDRERSEYRRQLDVFFTQLATGDLDRAALQVSVETTRTMARAQAALLRCEEA
jgi:predicted dehydrogenase